MKNFILIVIVYAVVSLTSTACTPEEALDLFTCEHKKTDIENHVCEQAALWQKGEIDDTDFFSLLPVQIEVFLPNRPDILLYVHEQNNFYKTEPAHYQMNLRKLSRLYGDKNNKQYDEYKSYNLYLSYLFQINTAAIYTQEAQKNIGKYIEKNKLYSPQKNALNDFKTFFDMPTNKLIQLGDQSIQKTKKFDYNNISAMHFYYIAYRKVYKKKPANKMLYKESLAKAYNIRKKLPSWFLHVSNDTLID